ncbi:hypothetical protein [Gordonia sihwensis]|uniref:hypothetical protein n=1 Tax=Gordonia sihwensis TaxID=173559 RepID=UPI0024177F3B|nr:hypothetical protein [Gordonia sihwensis]WFN93811.1 hypothetical protein P5P27_04430 [Gordonia sihwensis]
MSERNKGEVIPLWTLATAPDSLPFPLEDRLTPSRLSELRTVLAALVERPVATLEAHPRPGSVDTTGGLRLGSASPLAAELSKVAAQAATSIPKSASGEVLYRMVVPAKVAAQVSGGVLKPMMAKGVPGGVRGALVGAKGIGAQAAFVPVTAGAAGGSAATAGAAAAGAGALTVAAPLILLAVAAGASAYSDQQRRKEMERITELLDKLHLDRLDDERDKLDGCRGAIDKATAILLDKGKVGATLGIDSATHTIDTSLAAAARRIEKWQDALDELPADTVELPKLNAAIEGVESPDSEFYAHLELAELAIALKRRVIVLQAVEHAQQDPENLFESFTSSLKLDSQNLDAVVTDLHDVLTRLSTLRLDRPRGVRDFTFRAGSVDRLLDTSYRLRALGDRVPDASRGNDVIVDVIQQVDGSVTVLPAARAPSVAIS